MPFTPPGRLPPRELAARLDLILATAQALVAGLDRARMDVVPPERNRSVRELAFHVFRLAVAFVDAADLGTFPEGWLQERAPSDLVDGPAVARYGALVRARLAGWFQGAAGDEYDRTVQVYYGPQSGHALLERTTWHAGQHLRQLHELARRLDVPAEPLPAHLFRGLPMPDAVW
ncbi:MAG TPA: DinB family protein [Methylomirabilota bacterium]|nr:DinB family protein [Methylomirabilota bacterium]